MDITFALTFNDKENKKHKYGKFIMPGASLKEALKKVEDMKPQFTCTRFEIILVVTEDLK